MTLKRNPPHSSARILRALAHLLSYPDATLREHLPELRRIIHDEAGLSRARVAELDILIDSMTKRAGLKVESSYVDLFDRGRGTSLHLFEHVHGDSRDRGPAMIDLLQTYEQAGLYLEAGELPDYLPVVLQYASTQPQAEAKAFLAEIAHIVRAIFSALLRRESTYASVLAGILDLAGEKAQAVSVPEDPDLDTAWEEPLAFGGCSTAGQASPLPVGAANPIHVAPPCNASTNDAKISGVNT